MTGRLLFVLAYSAIGALAGEASKHCHWGWGLTIAVALTCFMPLCALDVWLTERRRR